MACGVLRHHEPALRAEGNDMVLRCPGRFTAAQADSVLVPCPECGLEAEIFGDEQRVKCRCGKLVFRDAVPSCAQWCPEAERCFGSAAKTMTAVEDTTDIAVQRARFRELQELVEQAVGRCSKSKERLQRELQEAAGAADTTNTAEKE